MTPLAIYIHTPFCPTKCGYCDFNSYAMEGEIMPRTAAAIATQIRQSPLRGRPAKTIFFGGGTPTFLAEEDLLSIFEAVLEVHPPMDGCEITSESNPGTADANKYAAMRRAGFNRLSLGAQSFLDTDLLALGRVHQASEIGRAVALARDAGFENLNLDLMFALPNQSRHAWNANLDRALALNPEHLSLYCLTLEPNTPFFKRHLSGELVVPSEEEQVTQYEDCLDRMVAAGYQQYEISNYARPGRECAHNLCYWLGEEYAGYGPGAVGAVELDGVRKRRTQLKHPERFCRAVENGEQTWFEEEVLDASTLRTERIMLGLRLNQGVALSELDSRGLKKVVALGWVEVVEDSGLESGLPLCPSGISPSRGEPAEGRLSEELPFGGGRTQYDVGDLPSEYSEVHEVLPWRGSRTRSGGGDELPPTSQPRTIESERTPQRARLTRLGRHFCSEVAVELI